MNLGYLKLDLNKFYTVALKYPKPTQVKGFHGPELRWVLSGGQALYTPAELEAELAAFKPGQRFQIGKFRNGREIQWKVLPPATTEENATSAVDSTKEAKSSTTVRQPGDKQPAAAILERSESLDAPVEEIPRTKLEDALKTAVSAAAAAEKHVSRPLRKPLIVWRFDPSSTNGANCLLKPRSNEPSPRRNSRAAQNETILR